MLLAIAAVWYGVVLLRYWGKEENLSRVSGWDAGRGRDYICQARCVLGTSGHSDQCVTTVRTREASLAGFLLCIDASCAVCFLCSLELSYSVD